MLHEILLADLDPIGSPYANIITKYIRSNLVLLDCKAESTAFHIFP
jgi:hypothetical protein